MDRETVHTRLLEGMRSIYGFALSRLGNESEAEELTSNIIYKVLSSAETVRDENRFHSFMWRIAENSYVDFIRSRTRERSRTAILSDDISDTDNSLSDDIISREEIAALRRELSLLSEKYRRAVVLYYMNDLSCSEIAELLDISTEMVKYYLFRGRKILKEGMNMERSYGILSYSPRDFEIDFWGTHGGEDNEYREFQRRKIKGNILLAAYYSPMTVQEISLETGVAVPYLEDEIKLLADRMYLTRTGEKYLTNITIITEECKRAIDEKMDGIIRKSAREFCGNADSFAERFGDRFKEENLQRLQKLVLCMAFSLNASDSLIENAFGSLPTDGPYSIVNGGGGSGVVWGREWKTIGVPRKGIRGIYENCFAADGRGIVSAMNLYQTLNAQHFTTDMTDPISAAAVGGFEYLPSEWQDELTTKGYVIDGKPNFHVWTAEEYEQIREVLAGCTRILTEMNQSAVEIAGKITADLAPTHVKKTAGYIGALVYRFACYEKLVDILFEDGWVRGVDDREKPCMFVVKN